jgi:hypothetical protein
LTAEFRIGKDLRADLVDETRRIVYEIKPEHVDMKMAVAQARKYVNELNKQDLQRLEAIGKPPWRLEEPPEQSIITYSTIEFFNWLMEDMRREGVSESERGFKALEILKEFGFDTGSLFPGTSVGAPGT